MESKAKQRAYKDQTRTNSHTRSLPERKPSQTHIIFHASLLLTKKNDITDNKEREDPALFLALFEFTEANLTELQRLDEGEIKVNNVIQTENF